MMYDSFTNKVLMIRPANFGYNTETSDNNVFQSETGHSEDELRTKSREEFDGLVDVMDRRGIDVTIWEDNAAVVKPDAVFPNNWFSTTPDGKLIIYPMYAENRSIERDPEIVEFIEDQFNVLNRYEMEHYESKKPLSRRYWLDDHGSSSWRDLCMS